MDKAIRGLIVRKFGMESHFHSSMGETSFMELSEKRKEPCLRWLANVVARPTMQAIAVRCCLLPPNPTSRFCPFPV